MSQALEKKKKSPAFEFEWKKMTEKPLSEVMRKRALIENYRAGGRGGDAIDLETKTYSMQWGILLTDKSAVPRESFKVFGRRGG